MGSRRTTIAGAFAVVGLLLLNADAPERVVRPTTVGGDPWLEVPSLAMLRERALRSWCSETPGCSERVAALGSEALTLLEQLSPSDIVAYPGSLTVVAALRDQVPSLEHRLALVTLVPDIEAILALVHVDDLAARLPDVITSMWPRIVLAGGKACIDLPHEAAEFAVPYLDWLDDDVAHIQEECRRPAPERAQRAVAFARGGVEGLARMQRADSLVPLAVKLQPTDLVDAVQLGAAMDQAVDDLTDARDVSLVGAQERLQWRLAAQSVLVADTGSRRLVRDDPDIARLALLSFKALTSLRDVASDDKAIPGTQPREEKERALGAFAGARVTALSADRRARSEVLAMLERYPLHTIAAMEDERSWKRMVALARRYGNGPKVLRVAMEAEEDLESGLVALEKRGRVQLDQFDIKGDGSLGLSASDMALSFVPFFTAIKLLRDNMSLNGWDYVQAALDATVVVGAGVSVAKKVGFQGARVVAMLGKARRAFATAVMKDVWTPSGISRALRIKQRARTLSHALNTPLVRNAGCLGAGAATGLSARWIGANEAEALVTSTSITWACWRAGPLLAKVERLPNSVKARVVVKVIDRTGRLRVFGVRPAGWVANLVARKFRSSATRQLDEMIKDFPLFESMVLARVARAGMTDTVIITGVMD